MMLNEKVKQKDSYDKTSHYSVYDDLAYADKNLGINKKGELVLEVDPFSSTWDKKYFCIPAGKLMKYYVEGSGKTALHQFLYRTRASELCKKQKMKRFSKRPTSDDLHAVLKQAGIALELKRFQYLLSDYELSKLKNNLNRMLGKIARIRSRKNPPIPLEIFGNKNWDIFVQYDSNDYTHLHVSRTGKVRIINKALRELPQKVTLDKMSFYPLNKFVYITVKADYMIAPDSGSSITKTALVLRSQLSPELSKRLRGVRNILRIELDYYPIPKRLTPDQKFCLASPLIIMTAILDVVLFPLQPCFFYYSIPKRYR